MNRAGRNLSAFISLLIFLIAVVISQWPASVPEPARHSRRDLDRSTVVGQFANLPLGFEENRGQADPRVRFLARGPGYGLFLTAGETILSLRHPQGQNASLRMKLAGSNADSLPEGAQPLAGKANYFLGDDPAGWRTGVPIYSTVRYRQLYAGVDLVYYGNPQQLEFDFVVSPGASPDSIVIDFDGAEGMELHENGDLLLDVSGQPVRLHKPLVYQETPDGRTEVDGRFALRSSHRVTFEIAAYDTSRPLVIDPVLSYSTFLGRNGWEEVHGIGVDAEGSVYVAGFTTSTDFPLQSPVQSSKSALEDVFVSKLSPNGSQLLYSTYLGGNNSDDVNSLAVTPAGVVTVAGFTFSTNFPLAAAFQSNWSGISDAWVASLNASGSALIYSTYLGGSGGEEARGVALDSGGNAYVTGQTTSPNFPLASPLQPVMGSNSEGFVTKFSASGAVLYSTFLGGNSLDAPRAIAVDAQGSAYVTGLTFSTNFPLLNPYQSVIIPGTCVDGGLLVPCYEGFVTKISPNGAGLVYSTFLGGNGDDTPRAIAVDAQGSAYIAGETDSTDFPTAYALRAGPGGLVDGFLTKLSPQGSSLVYSTYLAGRVNDFVYAVAVSEAGEAYVAGSTQSTDFPTLNSLQPLVRLNAFVLKLNPHGSDLIYSTFLGGSGFGGVGGDEAYALAIDAAGNAYVGGVTVSGDFPVKNAYQQAFTQTVCQAGNLLIPCPEGFVAKLSTLPQLFAGGVVNGASFANGAPVAAGSIVSAFGSDLVSSITLAQQVPLPTVLSNLTVRMNGILTPLYFVAGGQINLQVPWQLAGQSEVTVQVSSGEAAIEPVTVNLASAAPGIFSVNSRGTGQGAILISNTSSFAAPLGSIPGAASRPANRGEFVTIYCTGLGPVSNQPATGSAGPSGPNLARTLASPAVTIGGVPANVSFSGLSPGFVGLYQIDAQIPLDAPTGNAVDVTITLNGAVSNTVQMAIQ